MKDEIIKRLVSVKSIVTFALIGVVSFLAIVERVEIDKQFFAGIVSSVVTYYFTRKENSSDDRQ